MFRALPGASFACTSSASEPLYASSVASVAGYLLARMMATMHGSLHPQACMAVHAHQHRHLTPTHAHFLCQPAAPSLSLVRSFKRPRVLQRPRIMPVAAAATNFYAQQATSFSSLGVEEELSKALERAGLTRPSYIQEAAAPVLLQGKQAVIAAETGSGKTLAYLLPIGTMLLRAKQKQLRHQYHALVLCPNQALCQQIVATVHALKGDNGLPLLSAAFINTSNPPPYTPPDIIVATPAGLREVLTGSGGAYGWLWTIEGFEKRVRHIVLDEADMLLGDAFVKPVDDLLQALRANDRRQVEAKVFQELGINDTLFKRLPRALHQACWRGGAPGLLAAGFRAPNPPGEDAVLGPYWKRQYVFAAATMPSITFSDVGSRIHKLYPDAEWIATDALHTSKRQVAHHWLEVNDDSWGKQLVNVIKGDPDYQAGKAKTLIFTKDTATADAASSLLHSAGVKHMVYHKNRPMGERTESLERMQQHSGGIMVCTDAAARGIDIPDVTHVIQSDFAPNAIDFLHRIGRTGRAGKAGKVTSMYRDFNIPLVEVLRRFIEEDRPLEAAFSRARSFSQKLKRKGKFVPRGMVASEYEASMK